MSIRAWRFYLSNLKFRQQPNTYFLRSHAVNSVPDFTARARRGGPMLLRDLPHPRVIIGCEECTTFRRSVGRTIDRVMYHNNNFPEIGPIFVDLGHASFRGLAIKARRRDRDPPLSVVPTHCQHHNGLFLHHRPRRRRHTHQRRDHWLERKHLLRRRPDRFDPHQRGDHGLQRQLLLRRCLSGAAFAARSTYMFTLCHCECMYLLCFDAFLTIISRRPLAISYLCAALRRIRYILAISTIIVASQRSRGDCSFRCSVNGRCLAS